MKTSDTAQKKQLREAKARMAAEKARLQTIHGREFSGGQVQPPELWTIIKEQQF